MKSPPSLTIQKDTESQDGSWTDKEITEKVRTFKSLPTFYKQNSEKISKECTKSDAIKVLDTNGDSKLEGSILRPLVEEERQLVWKERKNDKYMYLIYLKLIFNIDQNISAPTSQTVVNS